MFHDDNATRPRTQKLPCKKTHNVNNTTCGQFGSQSRLKSKKAEERPRQRRLLKDEWQAEDRRTGRSRREELMKT